MRLYSVVRFVATGSTHQNGRPDLMTADQIHTQPWFQAETTHANETGVLDLKEGENTVLSDDKPRTIHSGCGWRITRLPDYRSGRIVYDELAKEYVRITNGKCVLDHSSPEQFAHTHEFVTTTTQTRRECEYAPSEGIALRVFSSDGKVACAWTYRGLDPLTLRPVTADQEKGISEMFDQVISRRRSARFIGRI